MTVSPIPIARNVAIGSPGLPPDGDLHKEGQALLSRTKIMGLFVCWLIGLAFAAVSTTHALNYIGHPRSYFFFDTLLPVTLILGLLVATLRQMR